MSYLGQEIPTFTYKPIISNGTTPSSFAPITPSTTPGTLVPIAAAPLPTTGGNGDAWWQKIWSGAKEVLKTGTEAFATVAPYVFDGGKPPVDYSAPIFSAPILTPQTQTITDPNTGQKQVVTYTPYTPGTPVQTGVKIITLPSGQQVTKTIQRAGVLPPWAFPVALAIGGVVLMNMGKRRR